MKNILNKFGCMVFNDTVMKERLPEEIYRALKQTMTLGRHLELDVANIVAGAMKEWAMEKGVTHFTHWFQPMTGSTAEKHESFIERQGESSAITAFTGKSLVKGESDASSFPSGGLRATFEARGYSVWDTTSYAFIRGKTLYIPTAFCSYSGEALDKKTPLLRSMQAVDKQARRILELFGNTETQYVSAMVGPEQEYFLIDKSLYKKRPDLVYTGRTLIGARPPKGQEMDDHYYGCIKPRVFAYMAELDKELWKMGVYAKIKHNEAAPSQHELAPIFTTASIAADNNQLTMEMMKVLADKHGFACLLHEKPFAGINGSGKHNNWSLCTDKGVNLLEPGSTPQTNAQFLLFLVAVIKAVDEYQDLLRLSAADAGNDHRLGSNEAPPAIISMFLGDELTAIMESIIEGSDYRGAPKQALEIGVTALPHFPKDTTDRNRTSPFAYTGSKFEFRMVGSAINVADSNIVLNTIVAESLRQFADILQPSKSAGKFNEDLAELIKDTFTKHKRIVYNGNNYSEEWVKQAEQRGLSNLQTTADALPALLRQDSIDLFSKHAVFTEAELNSRYEILIEAYCKTINIEALTMIEMVRSGIIPAAVDYRRELAQTINQVRASGNYDTTLEKTTLSKISKLSAQLVKKLDTLENAVSSAKKTDDILAYAVYYRDRVLAAMQDLRLTADELERLTAKKHLPYPTYGELIYGIV